jgi:hypothetical protein
VVGDVKWIRFCGGGLDRGEAGIAAVGVRVDRGQFLRRRPGRRGGGRRGGRRAGGSGTVSAAAASIEGRRTSWRSGGGRRGGRCVGAESA